jgi:osmotically-inducible protein OsmY
MSEPATDQDIWRNVVEELRWSPEIDETDIAAKVNQGVVTLTGFVRTLKEHCAAERAVKRVSGVRALANDLCVRAADDAGHTDPELARAAAAAMERELPHSAHIIRIVVENGVVRLEGVVPHQYQKEYAQNALSSVPGIVSVRNLLEVQGAPSASDIREQIATALKRCAEIDAERIGVDLVGNKVTLTGHVRSWSEHEIAGECAGSIPGVMEVQNNIAVGP